MIEGLDVSGIVSVLGLLLGGSGGAFFTWRYMNRKAKVEGMRPFLCGDLKCKKRQLVALLENGESDKEGGTP